MEPDQPLSPEVLFQKHLPSVRAFVRLHVSPGLRAFESCSDLVQSACRDALAGWSRLDYRGEASFRHWLCTIALNKIRQRERFIRAKKRDYQIEAALQDDQGVAELVDCYSPFCTPSRDAMRNETIARVEQAFDQLTATQREIILLARVVGLSHSEIAAQSDRTETAVRSQLSRALVRLSALLDQD